MIFFSLVQCLCCQVEVSATGRSLVQRSHTDCGVSENDQVKINTLDTCCEQAEEGRTAKRNIIVCYLYMGVLVSF
jgi:hypothetical protein